MKPSSKQIVRRLAVLDEEFKFDMRVSYGLQAGHAVRLSSVSLPIVRVEPDGRLYINVGKGISGYVPAGKFHLEEEVETHTVTVTRRRIDQEESK